MDRHWIHKWEAKLQSGLTQLEAETKRDLATIRRHILDSPSYVFRNDKLQDIANSLSEETELDRLTKLLWEAAITADFQHSTLFVLEQGTGAAFRTRVCTTYPEDWIHRYGEKGYQYIDPVVTACQKYSEPFRFKDVKGTLPMELEFWKDAECSGIGTNGLAVPVSLPCGAKIAISYVSAASEKTVNESCDEHESDLLVIAYLAAEAFGFLARDRVTRTDDLTSDELRFLKILVASDEPQKALEVVPKFGSGQSMQNSIKQKLGVQTILQAVAIASKHSWLDGVPFEKSEVKFLLEGLKGWEQITTVTPTPKATSRK